LREPPPNPEQIRTKTMTEAQKIRILTDAKDDIEKSLPKLKAAGYDASELQDFLKHLRLDITDLMVSA
jgi:hypothetical protein